MLGRSKASAVATPTAVSTTTDTDQPATPQYLRQEISQTEFLNLFQLGQPTKFHITLPYSGQPLPFIDVTFEQSPTLGAKIFVTQELATTFMEYVYASRKAAKISH
jgi:hypothetical protein